MNAQQIAAAFVINLSHEDGDERCYKFVHPVNGRRFTVLRSTADEGVLRFLAFEAIPNGRFFDAGANRYSDHPGLRIILDEHGPNAFASQCEAAGIEVEGIIRMDTGYGIDSHYRDSLLECAAAIVKAIETDAWLSPVRDLSAQEVADNAAKDRAEAVRFWQLRARSVEESKRELAGTLFEGCYTAQGNVLPQDTRKRVLAYLNAPSQAAWLEIRGTCVFGGETLWQVWLSQSADAPRFGDVGFPRPEALRLAVRAAAQVHETYVQVKLGESQRALDAHQKATPGASVARKLTVVRLIRTARRLPLKHLPMTGGRGRASKRSPSEANAPNAPRNPSSTSDEHPMKNLKNIYFATIGQPGSPAFAKVSLTSDLILVSQEMQAACLDRSWDSVRAVSPVAVEWSCLDDDRANVRDHRAVPPGQTFMTVMADGKVSFTACSAGGEAFSTEAIAQVALQNMLDTPGLQEMHVLGEKPESDSSELDRYDRHVNGVMAAEFVAGASKLGIGGLGIASPRIDLESVGLWRSDVVSNSDVGSVDYRRLVLACWEGDVVDHPEERLDALLAEVHQEVQEAFPSFDFAGELEARPYLYCSIAEMVSDGEPLRERVGG